MIVRLFSLILLFLVISNTLAAPLPPSTFDNVTQLITSNNYPCEQHYVTTDDGYILSIQRIPYGANNNFKGVTNKPVVYLQHGVLDSSDTWVVNPPNESLGFILADQGFDVWLGNARGNLYSNQNIHYTEKQAQFWNFNWDQMASFDLPSTIDYILAQTGQQNLTYFGHSQGTTAAFAQFTNDPELAKKINLFFALAPVAYIGHTSVPLLKIMADIDLQYLFELFGTEQFLPSTQLIEKLLPDICNLMPPTCEQIYCLIAGCDFTYVNVSRLPLIFSHLPAGTSAQDMYHWSQIVKDDLFQCYNYGSASANQQHYNQPTPPLYDLSKLTVPTIVYHGGRDTLADPIDVAHTLSMIPSSTLKFVKFLPDYGHGDFVWGVTAASDIYNPAIAIIKSTINY